MLYTDLAAVYYTLTTGKGLTIRQNVILQELDVKLVRIKTHRGHTLVTQWVPPVADPLS
jgi:hypothetical protein